jgi:hypothetical protein
MLKSSSLCGMVHGSDQGGATDKNSHEAREARHDEIESDLVGTAAVGGPDPPCSTRASGPAPWQAGAGCGTPKRDAWRRERHAHRARGDRRSRPLFERPCAPAVEHRRRGRSWSATRRAGTVNKIRQAHEGARCSKVWGAVLLYYGQQCKRVNGCAGMAQVPRLSKPSGRGRSPFRRRTAA